MLVPHLYNNETTAPDLRGRVSCILTLVTSPIVSPSNMVQGLVLKDLLPHPETDPTVHEGKATTIIDAPTESHELALEAAKGINPDHGTGRAQVAHDQEVLDLGWNAPKEHVEAPLVGGLSNEDVWLLVRRFNKVDQTPGIQCYS